MANTMKSSPPLNSFKQHTCVTAFTLVEMLVVMGMMISLTVLSGPAFRALVGASSVDRAIADLSGTMEFARTYAMANGTYVRVVFATMTTPTGNRLLPATVALTIYPADGTLDHGTASDMEDPTKWRALGKPVVLNDLLVYNSINGWSPDTSADASPSSSTIDDFMRKTAGVLDGAQDPNYTTCIQFNPDGEAGVTSSAPSRYIKIALDEPASPTDTTSRNRNPFIIRLSGINGTITILRKGEGIR
jgi:type II secretory pathway pseudopilin PulG